MESPGEDAEVPDAERGPKPYVFDPADVVDGARALDAAFADPIDGWDGWGALDEAVKDLGLEFSDPCLRALTQLSARDLDLTRDGGVGAELAEDGVILPLIKDVPADEVRLWESLAEHAVAPAALARLHDVLFVRRSGNPWVHARVAVGAYCDAIAERGTDFDAMVYLLRAWTLCRRVKAADLEGSVLDEIERRVDALETAGVGHSAPGVMYPLLEAMCETPLDAARAAAMRDHADAILGRLAADVHRGHLATRLATMRRKIADSAESADALVAIHSDEVDGYLRDAWEAGNAMVKLLKLEDAARIATQRGLPQRVKEITAQMQEIKPDDLGFETFSTSVPVPTWVPEAYLNRFTRGTTWRDGMARFLLAPEVPSGRLGDLRRFAAESRGSLRRIFPSAILGPDGMPRTTLASDEDKDQQDMALSARTHAEWSGKLLGEGLQRVADQHGTPDVAELTLFLTDFGALDVAMARSLAKSFGYFWGGDYEACICVVVPKIEAAARNLLRQLDEGIYQVEVGKSKGGYPGLGVLLAELEKLALDQDWVWFLRWLLLSPPGMNVRNDIAHGFRSDLGPVYAALVLRAAALLITATPQIDGADRTLLLVTQQPLQGRARVQDAIWRRVSVLASSVQAIAEGRRLHLRRPIDPAETEDKGG